MKKWGNIILIFSFFYISIGIAGYLLGLANHLSAPTIFVALAAFFAAIIMRSERTLPIVRFASGLCLAAAVFLQAVSIKNDLLRLIFYIGVFLWLIIITVDFYKILAKKTDKK